MSLNLALILQGSASQTPKRVAIRSAELEISYVELDLRARKLAAGLDARGIVAGDRVAILLPNVPEFSVSYFGILYRGATVVPLNVLLSASEVEYHLRDSGAKLLIAHPLFQAAARAGAQAVGVPIVWSSEEATEGGVPFSNLLAARPVNDLYPTQAEDTAVILYTSGTTGRPKGAELTHANLFLNCTIVVPKLLPISEQAVALATLPFFHSFGQTAIQNAFIAAGGSFSLLPRFSPEQAFEIIERDHISVLAGVPTMYFALLHHGTSRKYDLSKLKFCLSGGAPMPVEVLQAFETRFGVEILEGYGLSETSPVASFNMLNRPRKVGSIGYPVWGVSMQVVDQSGMALPDGELGEICIRGHNVMKGYWQRPEATQESLIDGWFHTGDIGYRDTDGCYFIVDRKKDLILRGGFNVYPREVEEILYAHPAVMEAAVIGIPDPSHGEEVKAIVVRKPGAALGEEELRAYCKERLAAYKYPRVIEFRDVLPKGPTGKILKRELR